MTELMELPSDGQLEALEAHRQTLAATETRGEEALGIEDPQFRELAGGAIASEQATAFGALQTAAENIPWTDLTAAHAEAEAQLIAPEDAADAAQSRIETALEKVEAAAQQAIRLAPSVQAAALALAEARRQELLTQITAEINAEQAAVQARLERIAAVIERAGAAWAVPKLINVHQPYEPLPALPEPLEIPEDLFITPQQRLTRELVDSLDIVSQVGQATELGTVAGMLVSSKKTLEKVTETNEDTGFAAQLAQLFLSEHGAAISRALAEKGLTMIHGWRVIRQGDATIAQERIVKVVPAQNATEEAYAASSLEDDNSVLLEIWTKRITENELPEKTITSLTQKPEGKGQRKPTWEAAFRQKLGEAINRLDDAGFLESEIIPTQTLLGAAHTVSNLLGTEENKNRLIKAGLLKRSALESGYTFSATEIVLMLIFNSNQNILSGPRQRDAVAIVEHALKSFFARKRA